MSVSTLVIMATEGTKSTFDGVLKRQIRALRKQLDKSPPSFGTMPRASTGKAPNPQHTDDHSFMANAGPNNMQWQTERSVALSAIALGRRYVY